MAPDLKPVMKWFGYSRRERRSTFILLILIVLVISLRYLLPHRNEGIEDISGSLDEMLKFNDKILQDTEKIFLADEGNRKNDSFKSSEFSFKQAVSVRKYKDPGRGSRKQSGSARSYNKSGNRSERISGFSKKGKDSVLFTGSVSNPAKLIDLNSCDSVQLDGLPGIGPVLSVRIIRYRNLLGGFVSREQLKEVYGLPEETYNMVAERVFTDSSRVKRINVNLASFKDFIRHPYFERYDVQAILKYRDVQGRINSLAELTDNKIITYEKAVRIRQYLSFGR
jgi:DNA uptake protein ComE-like DNA-binding protein